MIRVGSVRKKSDFIVSSFCTVATKEVKRELSFLISSIRLHYQEPIVIFCDEETETYYLENFNSENLIFEKAELIKPRSVVERNEYHRTDAIFVKMASMEFAIRKFGNSVFLDSDVFLLEPLSGPSDCSVALSHNMAETMDMGKTAFKDGMFNAGMLWSNLISFPQWWRKQYLLSKKDSFYEQGCLNRCSSVFRTGYFDLRHNYGFWRGEVGDREVHSFHCHMDDKLDSKFPEWMSKIVPKLRIEILKRLKEGYTDLYTKYSMIFS